MAFLFIVDGNIINPNPETLLISPFKEIWERDKSQDKRRAREDFTYIEFMSSELRSNPYRGYDTSIRSNKIIEGCISDKKYVADDKVKEGIKKIIQFQQEASPSFSYYLSVKEALEKMKLFFKTVDMDERTEKGIPIWKPRDITSALADTEKVIGNFKNLEGRVNEETIEMNRVKASKEVSKFSDPESIKD